MTALPTKGGIGNLGALTPLALRIKRNEKKQQFAEGLRSGALAPLQAGISGTSRNPIQTAVSPFEVISKLLQAGLARKFGNEADREYDDIAKEMGASRSQALGALGGDAANQQAALDAGIDPSVIQATREAKKLERVDAGGNIEFVDQAGQTVRSLPKTVTPDAQLGSQTTIRGQDLTAKTAAAGQRSAAEIAAAGRKTTERGQDISADTARANAAAQGARTDQRNAASLRKEFRSLPSVKAYESSLPIVESVRNAPDTPAGDLQVVYSVGKALDPDSVVREGELQLTQNATPLLQKVIGKVRAELSGQGRLTPQTRKDLVDMLDQRLQGYQSAYTRDFDTYSQYAGDIGAESDQIVGTRPELAFRKPASAVANDYSKLSDDELRKQLGIQ